MKQLNGWEPEFISLNDLSKKLGMFKTNLMKEIKAKKYGNINMFLRRDKHKGNQKVSVISASDSGMIKQARADYGPGLTETNAIGTGVFYVIQTNPNSIPNRYKFGFTSNLTIRANYFKIICPNLKIVKSFKCDSIHEVPLLRMIEKCGTKIGVEVFEVENIDLVIKNVEAALSILI